MARLLGSGSVLISSLLNSKDDEVTCGRVDVDGDLVGSRGLPVEESGDDERLCENVLGAVGADDRDLTWPRGRREADVGPRGGA